MAVAPIPAATKIKLRKNKETLLSPITPSIKIEDEYEDYLDTLVINLSEDIKQQITPIFQRMVSVQEAIYHYEDTLKSLEKQNKEILKNATYDASMEDIEALKSELNTKIEEMKQNYLDKSNSYVTTSELFVGAINSYTQNQLFNQIADKYGVSRTKFLSMDEVRKPFDKAVKDNVGLIKSVGDEYLTKVEKAVIKNFTTVAKKGDKSLIESVLDEREGVTLKRAKTIARDQSAKVTEAFNLARYENYGIKQAVWSVADFSDRTRPSHLALNGKIFNLEEGARKADGTYIHTGEEPNCRCTARPVIPDGLFD